MWKPLPSRRRRRALARGGVNVHNETYLLFSRVIRNQPTTLVFLIVIIEAQPNTTHYFDLFLPIQWINFEYRGVEDVHWMNKCILDIVLSIALATLCTPVYDNIHCTNGVQGVKLHITGMYILAWTVSERVNLIWTFRGLSALDAARFSKMNIPNMDCWRNAEAIQ